MMMGVLIGCGTGAGAQGIGGIFSQGGTILKEYARQIVALHALISETEKGYHIMENGLNDIGRINGDEFALHGSFFSALRAVNPTLIGMPAVQEVKDLEGKMLQDLSTASQRWKQGVGLTTGELTLAGDLQSNVSERGAGMLRELEDLLTSDRLEMTDGQRMARIQDLAKRVRELYAFVELFITRMEGLIAARGRGKRGEF